MSSKFTPEARAVILAALSSGRTTEQACEDAGVARATFQTWMRQGARKDASPEHREFREAVDRARLRLEDEALEEADLVRLLEGQARRGHIRAIELLLRRLDAQREPQETADDPDDVLAAVVKLADRRRAS